MTESNGWIRRNGEGKETYNSGEPQMFLAAAISGKTPFDVFRSLRLTCQLVILHPWFGSASRLPQAQSCEPLEVQDLERLINELSVITELVCLHGEHADTHRDAYLHLMGQIVATLISPKVENKIIDLIGRSDGDAIYQELARLRRLVIDSARARTTDGRQIA